MAIEGYGLGVGIVRRLGCGNLLNGSFAALGLLSIIGIFCQLTSFHQLIGSNYHLNP